MTRRFTIDSNMQLAARNMVAANRSSMLQVAVSVELAHSHYRKCKRSARLATKRSAQEEHTRREQPIRRLRIVSKGYSHPDCTRRRRTQAASVGSPPHAKSKWHSSRVYSTVSSTRTIHKAHANTVRISEVHCTQPCPAQLVSRAHILK